MCVYTTFFSIHSPVTLDPAILTMIIIIGGSDGSSISRNLYDNFHNGCISLHSQQKCIRILLWFFANKGKETFTRSSVSFYNRTFYHRKSPPFLGLGPLAPDETVTTVPFPDPGLQPCHSPHAADHVAECCSPQVWLLVPVPGVIIGCIRYSCAEPGEGLGWHP